MSHTHTAVTQSSLPWLPASPALRATLAIVGGSLLLAIAAHISVPLFFTPVPFTLQPMAVLLIGLMFEPTLAFATLVAYLAEGACGLPVFAPTGAVGMLHLMGPDGGFLMAYPFAVFLVSRLRRSLPTSFTFAAIAAAAGSVVYFSGGAAWLAFIAHQSLSVAMKLAVWPFIAGDALKVVLAAAIVTGFARFQNRLNAAREI